MKRTLSLRTAAVASIGLTLTMLSAGCHSGSKSTSVQFTASATPPAPGLIKLVEKARSGSRVVVDVLIFGPAPTLDLAGFRFGVRIGDTGLLRFVPQSSYAQTALVADIGQTIAVDVDGNSDPTLVHVDVEKLGGGAGNGVAGDSTTVVELAFDVQGAGMTTLTLGGVGNTPAEALDSAHAPIGAVEFDAASAGVTGVTTGGSGY